MSDVSLNPVSLNQNASVKKKSNLAKNTAIAAGVGAAIEIPAQFIYQSQAIKAATNKDIKKAVNLAKFNIFNPKTIKTKAKDILTAFKDGKFKYGQIGKAAIASAVIVATTYLAYKGIKSLFTNKN